MHDHTYSRGERMLFAAGNGLMNALTALLLGGAYLALSFALFGLVVAAFVWGGYHDPLLEGQFMRFSGLSALYLGAPLLGLACVGLFGQQAWRTIWGAPAVFEEKRLNPTLVLALAITCCMLTAAANLSLEGRWGTVPVRLAQALDVAPTAIAGKKAPAVSPTRAAVSRPAAAVSAPPPAAAMPRSGAAAPN